MNVRDLKLRLRALIAPRRVEHELDDELAFHIERDTEKHLANGLSPAEARRRALIRFGSVPLVADQCRDARGTALIDSGVRDILYAFRMFRRAPLTTFTIVATVALGLGLVAVVFTFFNVFLFRVDNVPNIDEIFAVERPRTADGDRVPFTRAQYDALRKETNVFVDPFAMLEDIDSRIDGRMMAGTLVSGNFFRALGVNAALGRTLTPEDDDRYTPRPVIVLSDKGWSRIFSNDSAVIGRRLLVNGFSYEIVGVMPPGFRGLAVGAPDYWAPISLLGQFRPIHAGREDAVGIDIIGRLKPELWRETALAGLAVWDSGGNRASDRRGANILLEPRRGTIPQPTEALILFTPLFFAFGLILVIGCANVANLLLARGISRQREIGVRLSLGASRQRIIRQLLTESLLLALASAAFGFVISRVVQRLAIYAITSTMPADLGDVQIDMAAADWRVVLFLVVGAIASTAFFGLAPALQATRVELVRAVRGEVTRDTRPGRARHWLIAIQVTASALLLICSAIFLRSAFASAIVDPGVRTDDTILIDIVNEPLREAMVQAVGNEPLVTAVAASWPGPLAPPRAAFAEGDAAIGKAKVSYKFVSPEYFDVLGVDILRGRGFTNAERDPNAAVVIVADSVARQLWMTRDAVGQVLHLEPDPNSETRRDDEPAMPVRTFTVVGIARDVAGFRFADFEQAGIYIPTSTAMAETSLTVRVQGHPDQARTALLRRLTAVDPNMGQVITMRTMARIETYFLQIAFGVTIVLGGLALALTLSGLFSVLSYLVEQRMKEIGVRMALGATTRNVGRLVLLQSARPVGFGLIAGTGMALGLALLLLATPAASMIGTIVQAFDPVAYLASLAAIVAACVIAALIPALRAARIDPMTALRQE